MQVLVTHSSSPEKEIGRCKGISGKYKRIFFFLSTQHLTFFNWCDERVWEQFSSFLGEQ